MLKAAHEFCDAGNQLKPEYREQAIRKLIGDRGLQLFINMMRNLK